MVKKSTNKIKQRLPLINILAKFTQPIYLCRDQGLEIFCLLWLPEKWAEAGRAIKWAEQVSNKPPTGNCVLKTCTGTEGNKRHYFVFKIQQEKLLNSILGIIHKRRLLIFLNFLPPPPPLSPQ